MRFHASHDWLSFQDEEEGVKFCVRCEICACHNTVLAALECLGRDYP